MHVGGQSIAKFYVPEGINSKNRTESSGRMFLEVVM